MSFGSITESNRNAEMSFESIAESEFIAICLNEMSFESITEI